jgi:hypothetical protein
MATITTNPAVLRNPAYAGGAIWSYVKVQQGPVRGPQPRLAQGTGRTGTPAPAGQASKLPGYLSEQEYKPAGFEYAPENREAFLLRYPPNIGVAVNGRDLVGTYDPHDSTPGRLFSGHMRRAQYWQVQEFPPNVRQLLAWQQVMRYRVNNLTMSARPLNQSNYFLGYVVDPQVSSAIGATGLGYM